MLESSWLYRPFATDWNEVDVSADGGNATITIAAEAGKTHYLTTILASFEADNQAGEVTVTCGGTTIIDNFITGDPLDLEFSIPVECEENAEIVITLTNASQQKCSIFAAGYTR
jgi:hypothetical protein